MPTVAFKATEMTKAKVLRISLVDRSATRSPFKVIKQEKPMQALTKHFDLSSVFKRAAPAPEPAFVAGVITMKSDNFDSIKGQIAEAGFTTERSVELDDGSVVFAQVEDMPTDAVVVRVSEHALLAVKGFTPHAMDMAMADGQSFVEVCKAQGFYPGVGTVVDVLRSSVLTLAEKSDDSVATAVGVAKMFDEAKAYAVAMVRALPAMAFKLETVFPHEGTVAEEEIDYTVSKQDGVCWDGYERVPGTKQGAKGSCRPIQKAEDPVEKAFKLKAKAPAMDPMGEAEGGADKMTDGNQSETDEEKMARLAKEKAMKADDTPVVPDALTLAEVTNLLDGSLTKLTKKMDDMLQSMASTLSDLSGSVQTLSGRVESAETVAKAAKQAVESTVLMGSGAGDHVEAVVKRDYLRGREIDTGFAPRPRRQAP